MKKGFFILIFCLIFSFVQVIYAQNDLKSADDIWDDYYPTGYTDSTSWEQDDFIYLAAGESLFVFLPLERSQGAMWVHGYITAIDTLFSASYSDYGGTRDTVAFNGTDSLYLAMAPHTGSGRGMESNEAETYTLFDSCFVTSANGTNSFGFWPMANSVWRNYTARYYTLLMYNQSGGFCKIKLTVEWLGTYKKY